MRLYLCFPAQQQHSFYFPLLFLAGAIHHRLASRTFSLSRVSHLLLFCKDSLATHFFRQRLPYDYPIKMLEETATVLFESETETVKAEDAKAGTVCVTGAGGFIASWLVKHLLQMGYYVKGTVRNPDDPKNAHLKELKGAQERLVLAKADLMDFDNILSVVSGCDGVFHLASPVTDDPAEMVEPAVTGTLNVLNAAAKAGVKRVVITSSIGAVYMDPNRDPNVVVDESCWSDLDYCKNTKNWYCYGKMVAEKAAWDFAKEKGIDLVVLNPSLVLGPLLQPTMNASTIHILKYLTGSAKTYANLVQAYVDVRDVADACVLLYETPSATGRFLCAESVAHRGDICDLLADLFPQYPIPRKCSDEKRPKMPPYQFSNQKLCNLGLVFTPLRQCLQDTVVSLQEKGIIHT